jgi:hypothetical protein
MRNGEIPKRQWPAFFRSFRDAHRGHLCELAVLDGVHDAKLRLQPLLLTEVGPENDVEDARIQVVLCDWYGDKLAHFIVSPRHVRLHEAREGVVETLEIDGAAGKTMLRFEAAC